MNKIEFNDHWLLIRIDGDQYRVAEIHIDDVNMGAMIKISDQDPTGKKTALREIKKYLENHGDI